MSIEHERLSEIFSEALSRTLPEDRANYLEQACSSDSELRRQVEALLLSLEQAGNFLRKPPLPAQSPAPSESPGTQIGHYKLLQQIGEGGCGVVYMAEQQEPVRRRVALKIIKLGMDTRQVIGRFEAERQALAMMDHPNIARVLDAGATETGRPYFVMELVRGVKVTDYCDQQNLSTRQRLDLFLPICQAVQHAHQKGIIHRDLKPSNILVTEPDGVPIPKIIDFGIAKATGPQQLTDKTVFTAFEQFVGTPAYMSPEQAGLGGMDVDTRSDIYSLGVLLYELLTGHSPFESPELKQKALDEVFRAIREQEPPRPSTKLTSLTPLELTTVAQRRQVDPDKLPKLLSGDLDWIIMKAIEKDRRTRYETANALARDVERHLMGEPVLACPPSAIYRTRKFVRRHRTVVTMALVVSVSLVLGLAVALCGWAQARRANRRAEAESAVAKAINDFLLNDLLAQASPEHNDERDVKLRDLIIRAADRVNGRFTNQPLVEASICFTLGETFKFIDAFDRAEPLLRRALELRTKALGPEHPDTLEAKQSLAHVVSGRGDITNAVQMLLEVAQIYSRSGSNSLGRLEMLRDLGQFYIELGRLDQAEPLLEQVRAEAGRLLGTNHWVPVQAMNLLAKIDLLRGQPEKAAALNEQVLEIERPGPSWHTDWVVSDLGQDYINLGNYQRAADLLSNQLNVVRRRYGADDRHTAGMAEQLLDAYAGDALWPAALRLCTEMLKSARDPGDLLDFRVSGALAAHFAGDQQARDLFVGRLLELPITNKLYCPWVAAIALVSPYSNAAPQTALTLSDTLPDQSEITRLAKGMAAYRRADLSEAARFFQGWRSRTPSPDACVAGCFCAMIVAQTNASDARHELDEVSRRLTACLGSGDIRLHWPNYALAVAARREAEQLILGHESSPTIDSAWIQSTRGQWNPVRQHLKQAEHYAAQKKWLQARDEYLAALHQPAFRWEAALYLDFQLPSKIEITLALAKDLPAHRQVCESLFSLLDLYPEPEFAYRILKGYFSCEVNPVCSESLTWPESLKTHSGGITPDGVGLLRTMASYRCGRYLQVVQESEAANNSRLSIHTAAQVFRAMARYRLGNPEQGRKDLAEAEARVKQSLSDFNGDSWWDLGLCQLALDEAHRLVGERAVK